MLYKPDNKIVGNKGEDIAANYLENSHYKVLTRNFRTLHGEIDIIAEKDNFLVFIEVKTRRSLKFGPIPAQVNIKKLERIEKVAEEYIVINNYFDKDCQIDLICVFMDDFSHNSYSLEHFKNVFHDYYI